MTQEYGMTGYTKLFGSIVASTIWREPKETKIVWITMLALANKSGVVEASIPGLADLARVSIPECEASLACLMSPDPYSRTKDNEGRRVEEVDGGWRLLNHAKYRAKMGKDERREYLAQKQRESRARKSSTNPSTNVNGSSASSTPKTHADAQSDANAEADPSFNTKGSKKVSNNLPTSEPAIRIANLFSRKLTTAWNQKEIQTFKALSPIDLEDLGLIEAYYASERARGDEGCHRRDLGTFLNNFNGELDRARGWKAKTAPKNSNGTKPVMPDYPPGFIEFLDFKGAPHKPYRQWNAGMQQEFLNSEFHKPQK